MTFSYSRYNPQIKLSPVEMFEISQEINREFAPNFSTRIPCPGYQHKISPKEMFEISEEIRINFTPRTSDNTQELVILPVDPDHLYAYWNLGIDKLNTEQKNYSENQLTLRIYSEPNKNMDITKTKSWFDVDINSVKTQQKILLPTRTHESAYCATIGKRYPDNSLVPFASSNITHVPLRKVIMNHNHKVITNQVKESEIMFKPMPQPRTAKREISIYTNNSASGQGNN